MASVSSSTPEVERRALALFERLSDNPGNARLRERLLRRESEAVRARLASLEASATHAASALPTHLPGGDLDEITPPPARVGPFRLVERIGRGGMGDVWAGQRDDGLYEQTVAIKLIQRHALARAAEAFDDERRFLARLEHPNIARLIDGGVSENGLPWLALEYVAGQPIDVAAASLDLRGKIGLFIKAADAVQYAHSRMVAHADLKPANILVDANGRVKLLDFGISGLIGGEDARPTGSGPLTREFASPERLAGEGPSVADDVFALGKTLAGLISGAHDRELAAIAAMAHAPAARDRYGSVAELIADLDRWRGQLPVAAVSEGIGYRAAKFIARHRVGVMATVLALIGLTATSVIATGSYVRAEAARAKSEARFGEVRTLSHFMLYDLYEDLARQPGTVQRRAEVAGKAALYLERLQLSGDAPADLQLDTAASYRRLAAIQGYPGTSNLGQPEAAGASLTKAEGLLTNFLQVHPATASALTELGWVRVDRWALLGDDEAAGSALIASARDQFQKALSQEPGYPKAELGILATRRQEAFQLIWSKDQPAKAVPLLKAALVKLRGTAWPTALAAEVRTVELALLNQLGDAIYYSGDMAGALATYLEADRIIEQAKTAQGETPSLLIAKAFADYNISGTMGDLGGRNPEALQIANQGIARMERLLRAGPDASAEKILLILYGQKAVVLENMGQLDAALLASAARSALQARRLNAFPRDPHRMRDVAIGQMQEARLLGLAGRPLEACATAMRNAEMWAAIKTNGKLGAHDAAKEVPQSDVLVKKYCRT